jgi:hypothetical protein
MMLDHLVRRSTSHRAVLAALCGIAAVARLVDALERLLARPANLPAAAAAQLDALAEAVVAILFKVPAVVAVGARQADEAAALCRRGADASTVGAALQRVAPVVRVVDAVIAVWAREAAEAAAEGALDLLADARAVGGDAGRALGGVVVDALVAGRALEAEEGAADDVGGCGCGGCGGCRAGYGGGRGRGSLDAEANAVGASMLGVAVVGLVVDAGVAGRARSACKAAASGASLYSLARVWSDWHGR